MAQYAIWPSSDLPAEIMRLREFAALHVPLSPEVVAWKPASIIDLGWMHSKLYHEDEVSGKDNNLHNRNELLAMMRNMGAKKKLAKARAMEKDCLEE